VGRSGGLEVGLFYFNKPYLRTRNDEVLIESIDRLYITTGYRRWWSNDFSTALGIFSSYSIGDAKTLVRTGPFPLDFTTSARKISEHGLDASIRFELESSKHHGVAIDLRYSFNLNPFSGEKANHYALNLTYIRRVKVK